MKVQELLMNVYNQGFNITEELEVKHYIPIMDKKKIVMDVISTCTDENDGFVAVDRFKMNIYFNMQVLSVYTNLEVSTDFEEMVEQYDTLCEHTLLNAILGLFIDDYNMMCSVLEGMLDELLIQNSIEAQVVKIANKINNIIDIVTDNFDKVDLNAMLPDGVELNQLVDMVNKLK